MTAYAFLIAFGRTEPRGIQTLGNNLYYAYTAHFFLLAGCIPTFPREKQKSPKLLTIGNRRLLAPMLVTLCALNVAEVSKLTQQMRYEYSEPRQALISEISAGIAEYAPDERFVFLLRMTVKFHKKIGLAKGRTHPAQHRLAATIYVS